MTLVHKTLRIQVTLLINVPQQCRQLREDISKSTVEVSASGLQEGPRNDCQVVNKNTQMHLKVFVRG